MVARSRETNADAVTCRLCVLQMGKGSSIPLEIFRLDRKRNEAADVPFVEPQSV
jgi:hypothetical protein